MRTTPEVPEAERGERVRGYRLHRKLGAGSSGTVYLCSATAAGTTGEEGEQGKGATAGMLCLKAIPLGHPPRATSGIEQHRAHQEHHILATLPPHPHVLPFVEAFLHPHGPLGGSRGELLTALKEQEEPEEGPHLCIITRYARHGDLDAYLRRRQRGQGHTKGSSKQGPAYLPEGQVWRWAEQLLSGLHHIHAHGILHRDLKSKNILVHERGCLVIADFGIARPLGAEELARTAVGTPFYLSPELVQGQPYGPSSDVWSLGCVLAELCSLEHPFFAPSLPALMERVRRADFPPLPAEAGYSRALQALIACMLQLDPQRRPAVGELLRHVRERGTTWAGPAPRHNIHVPLRVLSDTPANMHHPFRHEDPSGTSIFLAIERERAALARAVGGERQLIWLHQQLLLRHQVTQELSARIRATPHLLGRLLRLLVWEGAFD